MKNLILVFISSILFLGCEKKFDDTYFPNSYAFFYKKDISKKQLKNANHQLLDSLLKYSDTTSLSQSLYCHNDDFLKKPNIDNKIQKQELYYWQACMDSIYKTIDDPKLIHYRYLAHEVKSITKKDLKRRAKAYESNENRNFTLAIFFSEDSIYECLAEYIPKINLIVIYDYQNTVKYGTRDQCLGRTLLFFHELFHADKSSKEEFGAIKQHILINFYEKEIVKAQIEIKDYIEELLTYNLNYPENKFFIEKNYFDYGENAIETLQDYALDCFNKKALKAFAVRKIMCSQNTNPLKE